MEVPTTTVPVPAHLVQSLQGALDSTCEHRLAALDLISKTSGRLPSGEPFGPNEMNELCNLLRPSKTFGIRPSVNEQPIKLQVNVPNKPEGAESERQQRRAYEFTI